METTADEHYCLVKTSQMLAYIKKMKKNNSGENPYHHSNDFDANHNLKEFLEPNHQIALDWSIAEARQCGLLYANLVWLLK
ncbi:MAG TPA: hypothetical protein VER98_14710, partial [Terriglobia bacterium]|nr:hypothetical protein [Terriglobia bacterium]